MAGVSPYRDPADGGKRMTETIKTDDVYQAHRDKVLNIEDNNPDIINRKYPAGYYIKQIKDYAHTSIPEEDASRVRCMTFSPLINACKFIAANEDIPESKVYPALRHIGYNIRYHNLKCDNPDNLYNLGGMVKKCVLTMEIPLIEFATGNTIFKELSSMQYRMHKDDIAIAMKDAEYCGIKVSELNLYNVLEGINVLILNEPDYILLGRERIFKSVLLYFADIKLMIDYKYGGMEVALSKR